MIQLQPGDRVRLRNDIDEDLMHGFAIFDYYEGGEWVTVVRAESENDFVTIDISDLDCGHIGWVGGEEWRIQAEAIAEVAYRSDMQLGPYDRVRIAADDRANNESLFCAPEEVDDFLGAILEIERVALNDMEYDFALRAGPLGHHNDWVIQAEAIESAMFFDSHNPQNQQSNSRPSHPGRVIEGYHDKCAVSTFGFGKRDETLDGSELYFGIEMEYEVRDRTTNEAAQEIYDDLKDWAFMSGDGSLNNGFEIVTQPTSQSDLEEKFQTLFDKRLTTNHNLVVRPGTGLHINISKSAFANRMAIANAIIICNNFNEFTDDICGRGDVEYSRKSHKNLMEAENDVGGNDKYSPLHVKMSHVEIRMFKATTHEHKFKQRLDLARLIVEYSNKCSREDVMPSVDGLHEMIQQYAMFESLKEFISSPLTETSAENETPTAEAYETDNNGEEELVNIGTTHAMREPFNIYAERSRFEYA